MSDKSDHQKRVSTVMIVARKQDLLAAVLASALCVTSAHAPKAPAGAPPTPGFNTYIPQDVLTPNTVQNRIGTLNFVDGVPTEETARLAFDTLDFLRGAIAESARLLAAAESFRVRTGYRWQPVHHRRAIEGIRPTLASAALAEGAVVSLAKPRRSRPGLIWWAVPSGCWVGSPPRQ